MGQSRTWTQSACDFPVEDCSSDLPELIRHSILSLKNKGGSSEPKDTKKRCVLIANKIISNHAHPGNRTHQVENKMSFVEDYLPGWGSIFFRGKVTF